jgi:hypothetical protein
METQSFRGEMGGIGEPATQRTGTGTFSTNAGPNRSLPTSESRFKPTTSLGDGNSTALCPMTFLQVGGTPTAHVKSGPNSTRP